VGTRVLSRTSFTEDVQRGMDAHGVQKLQSHRCRIDDFLEGEGTDEPGGQLLGFHLVPSGEPHLLVDLVDGRLGAVSVGGGGIAVNRVEE